MSRNCFISIGRWEGSSLLLLLGVAMPLKYLFGYPFAVRVIGSAHGVLFLLYVGAAVSLYRSERWSIGKLIRCWVASCVPFGTFVFERDLSRQVVSQQGD